MVQEPSSLEPNGCQSRTDVRGRTLDGIDHQEIVGLLADFSRSPRLLS
jgi:hypothetical protein